MSSPSKSPPKPGLGRYSAVGNYDNETVDDSLGGEANLYGNQADAMLFDTTSDRPPSYTLPESAKSSTGYPNGSVPWSGSTSNRPTSQSPFLGQSGFGGGPNGASSPTPGPASFGEAAVNSVFKDSVIREGHYGDTLDEPVSVTLVSVV